MNPVTLRNATNIFFNYQIEEANCFVKAAHFFLNFSKVMNTVSIQNERPLFKQKNVSVSILQDPDKLLQIKAGKDNLQHHHSSIRIFEMQIITTLIFLQTLIHSEHSNQPVGAGPSLNLFFGTIITVLLLYNIIQTFEMSKQHSRQMQIYPFVATNYFFKKTSNNTLPLIFLYILIRSGSYLACSTSSGIGYSLKALSLLSPTVRKHYITFANHLAQENPKTTSFETITFRHVPLNSRRNKIHHIFHAIANSIHLENLKLELAKKIQLQHTTSFETFALNSNLLDTLQEEVKNSPQNSPIKFLNDDSKREIAKKLKRSDLTNLLRVSKSWYHAIAMMYKSSIFEELIEDFPKKLQDALKPSRPLCAHLTNISYPAEDQSLLRGAHFQWVSNNGVVLTLDNFGNQSIVLGKDGFQRTFIALKYVGMVPIQSYYSRFMSNLGLQGNHLYFNHILIICQIFDTTINTTRWIAKTFQYGVLKNDHCLQTDIEFDDYTQDPFSLRLIDYLSRLILQQPCGELDQTGSETNLGVISL